MRDKKVRLVLTVCVLLALVSGIWTYLSLKPAPRDSIVITVDGEVIYEGSGTESEPKRVTVKSADGENVILIDSVGVRVESADCPDKSCVKMGYLKSANLPIVCLPHRLVISFGGASGEMDAVSK